MEKFWIFVLSSILSMQSFSGVKSLESMTCKYAERGSLTARCSYAVPSFFRATVYHFDHLDETLECDHCNLTNIEGGTFDIGGNMIKKLVLYNSNIQNVSVRAFTGLVHLEELILSNNRIKSFIPGAFYGIKKLTDIYMNNALDCQLPNYVFSGLKKLKRLYLSNNGLNVLENQTFEGLDSLEYLDLSHNQIVYLNQSLLPLKNLEILIILDNRLLYLHSIEFSGLNRLFNIMASKNELKEVAFKRFCDNNIRSLDLSHNKLTVYGSVLECLHKLETLNLQHNNIKNIQTSMTPFAGMYNLRTLNLANNIIQTFTTGSFTGLPLLQTLNLSSNVITTSQITGILVLPHLYNLDLSNNYVTDFDITGFMTRLPRLHHISLKNNSLSCNMKAKLQVLFSELHFEYDIDSSNCTIDPIKARMSLREDLESPGGSTALDVFIWVLTFVLILLVVLLYIGMFYLIRRKKGYIFYL